MAKSDAITTGVLLIGGGAAGYALGRLVLEPSRSGSEPLTAHSAARTATTAPIAPSSSIARTPVPPPHQATTAITATRSLPMPVDPYAPIPASTPTHPLPSGLAGPPASAQPIDPYAEPAPDGAPRVHGGPPAGAIPIDPYTTPARVIAPLTVPAQTGPITSPSQLATTPATTLTASDSAQLGAELADLLTSTGPSASPSRRPVLPPLPTQSGPVTSPAQLSSTASTSPIQLEIGPVQVTTPSAPARAWSRLPHHFDPVLERYRGSIPLEYLRALVARESSFQPHARTGSAIGLMQIIPIVLADYNKRHGTTYLSEHLVDPSINVAIGCELLRLIVGQYRRYHLRVPNLQPDWNNPRFVELLTFGWNAGYSEAGGVGRVARYLESLGIIDVTIDRIHAHARTAGASKHLSNAAKVRWCKSVVALYVRERAHAQRRPPRSAANPY